MLFRSIYAGAVTQPKVATGVGVTGPAFSAWISTTQSLSAATWTKVAANTEVFDTANCYDSTTNYRFTPNVAGYYQVSTTYTALSTGGATQMLGFLYMNGGQYRYMGDLRFPSGVAEAGATSSTLVYMNGTTDYLEFYAYISTATATLFSGSSYAYTGWTEIGRAHV